MDGDRGSTRNVIEKLKKENELKNFEAGKFSAKYEELQRKLTDIVDPNLQFALETRSKKASKIAASKAALESKIASRNDEMDHAAQLLETLKLHRENKRQVDKQKHKLRLEMIKKKTAIYRKVASLARVANKLKDGNSISEATAAMKADLEKKKEKLKGLKDDLAKKSAAINELRQKKNAAPAQLGGQSGEEEKKKAERMRYELERMNELQYQLEMDSKYMDGSFDGRDFVDDSGYNDEDDY